MTCPRGGIILVGICICNDAPLDEVGPLKKYINAPIRLFDGSAMLKFKQTDIQTVQTIRIFLAGNEFTLLRVVSSVLLKEFQINTLISCCKKCGRVRWARMGRGRGWEPVASFRLKRVGARVWAFRW